MLVPNISPLVKSGPFVVESLISIVDFTEPFASMNMMCIEPLVVLSTGFPAPTAKSLTPSPSRSPMFSIERPK